VLLKVEFPFNAAHRLPLYEGPCFHTHGHNYLLVVYVESDVDPRTGLSMDFGVIKRAVRNEALAAIDHNDLNQVVHNPTAENVVTWIWQRLRPALPGLVELQLYETPDCGVIYRGKTDEQTTQPASS
jgi:6-pyruvoyltetrahydropterin/6-carboxytetrahydropterin synthase